MPAVPEASTRAWIGFIDSDDYIAPDMYERLHDLVKDPDVGIAICGVPMCIPITPKSRPSCKRPS